MFRSGKKSLFLAVALLLVWVATPATAQKVDNLCAGQNQNVGTVTVTNNATQVFVRYDITVPGAFITETHAHVANSLSGIPQNPGGPIPGQFSQKANHNPGVTTFTHTFNRPAGATLWVAAHAVVAEVDGGGGTAEVVDQQNPIITVTPGAGAAGVPASAIAFGDGWYSLGAGGTLIAEYECPLAGGVGGNSTFLPDINIWEKSFGDPPIPETAEVAVSANFGGPWVVLGTAGNTVPFAQHLDPLNGDYRTVLSLGAVTNARFLRVRDTSQPGDGNGFDIESIKSRQICTPVFVGEETAWGGACAGGTGTRFRTRGNWGTYLIYTPN